MEEFSLLQRVWFGSILYIALRPAAGHSFVCLDTVSLCACDATRLSVNCSNLGFRAVPLADIPDVTSSLGFGGNLLTAVLQDTFATLGSLLSLSLENNMIAYVESRSFNGTNELKYLDLSGNKLSFVPSALDVLTSLRVLNLSGNGLSYLSADVFQSFTQLDTLRLEHNELYSIPDSAFHPLANLELLYLDGNFISADPIGLFRNSTRLTQLGMSDNLFPLSTAVGDWFGVSLQVLPLEELRLVNNGIQYISEATFRSCENLKELHLGENKVATIAPFSFANLTKLQNLTLEDNQLSDLPENLFRYTENLLSLSLKGNSLSALSSGVFNGLSQVLDLNLAGNVLEHLFISANGADSPFLPALRSLYLSSNSLTYVPDLRKLSNLETLDLSDNVLLEMDPYAFNGTSLRMLYLHDNLLTMMSLENFQVLPALETVTIAGNPWTCDCRMFWLVDPGGVSTAWRTALYDEMVCKAPAFAAGLDLRTLYLSEATIRKAGPFAPCESADRLTIVIIIAAWVVVFSIVLICYLARMMNYRKGCVKRTVKKKLVKATPSPPPPPPPPPAPSSSGACLNQGATFDELDKSTATDETYLMGTRDGDDEPSERQSQIQEQPTRKESAGTKYPVTTVISVV